MGCGASTSGQSTALQAASQDEGAAPVQVQEANETSTSQGTAVVSVERITQDPISQEPITKDDDCLTKRNGFISKGGDLLVETMTLDVAKKKALTLVGCRGFCFRGSAEEATSTATEMHFKNKFDNRIGENLWTSYRVIDSSPYVDSATSSSFQVDSAVSSTLQESPEDHAPDTHDLDKQPDVINVIGRSSDNATAHSFALPGVGTVPSFWRHTTKDLATGFDEKYEVPATRRAFLETLFHDTAGSPAHRGDEVEKTKQLRIVEALRIEDSQMWLQYDAFKSEMLKRRGKCTRPAQIDEGGPAGDRQVRTERLIEGSATGKQEAAALLANLNADVNEVYLWHGTSRAAWSAIGEDGFILRQEGGGRYGPGIYFAEDSVMCLRFAPIHEGEQAVLLCRVALGEPYYTVAAGSGATTRLAKAADKDSTLAHPTERWAREFIVFNVNQVYPEYALIVSTNS